MGEARPSVLTFCSPDVSAECSGSTVAIRESPVYLPGGITVGHYYIFSKHQRRMREEEAEGEH